VTALALVALLMPASTAFASGTQDAKQRTTQYGPLDGWAYGAIARYRAENAANPLDGWAYGVISRYTARTAVASRPSAGRNEFSWRDAGIGAAGASAVFLLVVGGLMTGRRRHPIPGLGS
jgi:hypothetical protein